MSFTDHKITQFAHRVADLPDEPQIPAADLKSRFDACPEELRQSLNAVCDDAARLEARVEGIVVDTFGDTIDKEMLSDELAAELDAKATQSALTTAIDAEATAREALEAEMEQKLAQKCEIYCGSYNNSGDTQTIDLGFRPVAVIICSYSYLDHINGMSSYADIAIDGTPSAYTTIVDNGFTVQDFMNHSADGGSPYRYIAFKPIG